MSRRWISAGDDGDVGADDAPSFGMLDPGLRLAADHRIVAVAEREVDGDDTRGDLEHPTVDDRAGRGHRQRRCPPGDDLVVTRLHVGDAEPSTSADRQNTSFMAARSLRTSAASYSSDSRATTDSAGLGE